MEKRKKKKKRKNMEGTEKKTGREMK